MTYVPTPNRIPGRPTRRAVDLSARISQVIVDFQRSHPDTRPGDVQQAMRLAWGSAFDSNRRRRALIMGSLTAGLLLLALGLFVLGA